MGIATPSAATGATQAFLELLDYPSSSFSLRDEVRDRVRAQQVSAIVRMTPALAFVNFANAVAMIVVLEISGQRSNIALAWATLVAGLAVWLFLCSKPRGGTFVRTTASARTSRKVVQRCAFVGLVWAVPGLFFLPAVEGTTQAFLASLVTGMLCGGAIALYPIPAAAFACSGLITLGGLIGLAGTGNEVFWGFAVITVAFFVVLSRMIIRHADLFVSEFVIRLELEEQKQLVEHLLEESRAEAREERRRSEERLAQAQKMEAIGRLTGGIAHDFNNLLAAIQGNAELLRLERNADNTLIDPILNATTRGADLTQGLLAFARRQTLEPRIIAVDTLLDRMTVLLRRSIGEHIDLRTSCEQGLWPVEADPTRLESTVLDLVLNARDAMPVSGALTLCASNARAETNTELRAQGAMMGDFVRIAVRDTGCGMDATTRERVLEPFFTSKKFGKGSGLGLSTAYGFALQSGGHINIESSVNAGTEVALFLPRASGAVQPQAPDTAGSVPRGSGEVVLIVEDDQDVQMVTARMVHSLNYAVLTATNAREAINHLTSDQRIDLVLTDLVLPGGMSGNKLAATVAIVRPDVPIVYMSGHAHGSANGPANSGASTARGMTATHGPMLRKPFLQSDIAQFLRSALDP